MKLTRTHKPGELPPLRGYNAGRGVWAEKLCANTQKDSLARHYSSRAIQVAYLFVELLTVFLHRLVRCFPVLPVPDKNLQSLERGFIPLLAVIPKILRCRPIRQIDSKAAEVVRLHLPRDVEDLARAKLQASW